MSKKKRKKDQRRKGDQFQMALMQAMNGQKRGGMLGGLTSMLPAKRSEQFLLGAAIGAAAAYLLSDQELRGQLIKSGIKLYSNLMGGVAEMKEQVADLQAEVEAERQGAL